MGKSRSEPFPTYGQIGVEASLFGHEIIPIG